MTALNTPLPEIEPSAHMFPDDLEKFKTNETFATAYSVPMGRPDGKSVALYTEGAFASLRSLADAVPMLVDAINAVLAYRVGDLPTGGYLRDNDKSRKALAELAAIAQATPLLANPSGLPNDSAQNEAIRATTKEQKQ